MSAPKRLWSGDWQHESAALSRELAERREQTGDPGSPAPPPHVQKRTAGSGRWRQFAGSRRALLITVLGLLILAGAAFGLTSVLGSPARPAAASANQPSGPVDWLGMEIESLQPGVVVVDTVALGSPAELAGMEPGDVIVEVNGRPVNTTGDIASAIAGLGMGDAVEIQVSRGSTRITTHATLAAPPVSYP